jgi:hypothetical protein
MPDELKKETIGELFMNVMQHMKCIEVRLDCAKALTSQKQKYAISQAVSKVQSGINTICDLLGDSGMVLKVKQDLDRADLVYVMLLTEQLVPLPAEDLEEITEIIDNYLIKKYENSNNSEQV